LAQNVELSPHFSWVIDWCWCSCRRNPRNHLSDGRSRGIL